MLNLLDKDVTLTTHLSPGST